MDFPLHKHTALKMDEALLTINNELDTEVVVSWVSERCYQVSPLSHPHPDGSVCSTDLLISFLVLQCSYQQLGVVPVGPRPGQPGSAVFGVNTQHEITLQLNSSLDTAFCT